MALSFAGKSSGSAINGGNTTLTISASAAVAGNYVVVTYASGTATTHSVTSSVGAGDPYTQIMATTAASVGTGTMQMSIWARKLSSTPITQAVCAGNGGSTNGTAAALIALVDDGKNPVLDVAVTSTSGSSTTQPNSGSITVGASNDVVLSCVACQISDATVTAPTSFLNQADANQADTVPCTVGMAMITLASTAAFDPAAWSAFSTAGVWVAGTVAVRAGSTALTVMPPLADENLLFQRPTEIIVY